MPEALTYDVIIIGGGPAGVSAALYTARIKLKTVVLDKSMQAGALGMAGRVATYPGIPEELSGAELVGHRRGGVRVRCGEPRQTLYELVAPLVNASRCSLPGQEFAFASGARDFIRTSSRALNNPGTSLPACPVSHAALSADGRLAERRICAWRQHALLGHVVSRVREESPSPADVPAAGFAGHVHDPGLPVDATQDDISPLTSRRVYSARIAPLTGLF
jgi:hypothetical protein